MIVGFALFSCACPIHAETRRRRRARIVAVGLFKNGLAIVKREAILGRTGTYVLDDAPQPVHGTYWVESAVPIETAVKMVKWKYPRPRPCPAIFRKTWREEGHDPLQGRQGPAGQRHGDEAQTGEGRGGPLQRGHAARFSRAPRDVSQAGYLVLQTAKGRAYSGTGRDRLRRSGRHGGESHAPEAAPAAHGRRDGQGRDQGRHQLPDAWPVVGASYRIDITDPKTLLDQQAVIKNELTDLTAPKSS